MAHYQLTETASRPIAERVAQLVETARVGFAKYRAYRTTIRELAALSDRELNDLSIPRGAIRGIAREAVYGN